MDEEKQQKCKACGEPLPPDAVQCPVCKWSPSTMVPRKSIMIYSLFMLFGIALTAALLWWVVTSTGAAAQ